MALSLRSPSVAVNDHLALWSPDFPPALSRDSASGHIPISTPARILAQSGAPGKAPVKSDPQKRARNAGATALC